MAGKKRNSAKLGKEPGIEVAAKKKRLTNSQVANFIWREEIETYTEMLAIAEKRQGEGQDDLAEFIFSRSEKHLRELLTKAWLMKDAPAKSAGTKISRFERVREALSKLCC